MPELKTDPDAVDLGEPVAVQVDGDWVVFRWSLIPKQGYDGWWIPHYWQGPGTRTWRGTTGGHVPDGTARFDSYDAAAAAWANSPEMMTSQEA